MKLNKLEKSFSTSDADESTINYSDGELKVTFKEYSGRIISLLFKDACMFSWKISEDDCFEEMHEVLDSPWSSSVIAKEEKLKHFKLYFNESESVLDVLAGSLEVSAL